MTILTSLNPKGSGRLSNRQRLLDVMRATGPIGRADLAGRLGVSVQAASNLTSELMANGLIRESGRSEKGQGPPVILYDLDPNGAFSIGFEIRPGAVYATLSDLSGSALSQRRLALPQTTPRKVITAMQREVNRLSADHDLHTRMIGAGVVRPGPFGATGLAETDTALGGFDLSDLPEQLEDALDMPVMLDNDANAGASAEHQFGRAKGVDDFAYLYFGTGLGLGVVSNGTSVSGAFGNAGEIGHLRLPGIQGKLETHLSRSAAQSALGDAGIQALRADDLNRLYLAGTPALNVWLDRASVALSQTVELVENLFDPATIIMGGAMPWTILESLRERCALPPDTVSNRPDRRLPRLQVGRTGPFTVSEGAAALMRNRLFQPEWRAL